MKLKWFCKFCQVSGVVDTTNPVTNADLITAITASHEEKRTIGGVPWIVFSVENGGSLSRDSVSNEITFRHEVPAETPEWCPYNFIVLHVQ